MTHPPGCIGPHNTHPHDNFHRPHCGSCTHHDPCDPDTRGKDSGPADPVEHVLQHRGLHLDAHHVRAARLGAWTGPGQRDLYLGLQPDTYGGTRATSSRMSERGDDIAPKKRVKRGHVYPGKRREAHVPCRRIAITAAARNAVRIKPKSSAAYPAAVAAFIQEPDLPADTVNRAWHCRRCTGERDNKE